jgi:hypothetical protein
MSALYRHRKEYMNFVETPQKSNFRKFRPAFLDMQHEDRPEDQTAPFNGAYLQHYGSYTLPSPPPPQKNNTFKKKIIKFV